MGYDLALTRARYPWENAGKELTLDDIRGLVVQDTSLEEASAGNDLPGIRWMAHPAGQDVAIWLLDGNLVAKNPDRSTITWLVDLASRLGARVVGDDGEIYARDGTWSHPEAETASTDASSRRSFFRSLVGRARTQANVAGARLRGAPFRKGDKVRDAWGNVGTVIGIEFVNGGVLDILIVRYDDGREVRRSLMAHGFEKIE
jgi:hypothetical protein